MLILYFKYLNFVLKCLYYFYLKNNILFIEILFHFGLFNKRKYVNFILFFLVQMLILYFKYKYVILNNLYGLITFILKYIHHQIIDMNILSKK